MHKIIITILILIFIASIGANIYIFSKQWYNKQLNKSFNAGVIWVFDQGKKLGQVSYTTPEGEVIILIIPNNNGK